MIDLHAAHPDTERLNAFAQGTLSDPECATIEEHLAGCGTCQRLLETLPDTPLALQVRAAVASVDAAASRLGLQPGYEILEEIGRGGMGVVYKAQQIGLHRLVAIKRIHTGGHSPSETLARFRREAETIARLDHPHVVRIHEVGEYDGQFHLVLEYAAGGTLADQLTGPLPPRAAAELAQTLARAVDHAHRRGIVHRDLKPANVLLMPGPEAPTTAGLALAEASELNGWIPKITDFGLAKDLTRGLRQTQTGAIVGTPAYMAPEQASGQPRQIGPPADLYALGAILYETLTGRPPFQGTTPLETLEQVRLQEPVPPSRLQPKMPRDLETTCLKCLRKEPRRRYASAAHLADDLRRFLAGQPVLARPVSRWEHAWRWVRRRPTLVTLLGVTLVATLALVATTAIYTIRLRAAVKEEQAQRRRAQANLRRANEAIEHLLTRMGTVRLYEISELQGVREEVLADARDLYEAMLRDQEDPDPETRYQHALTLCGLARLQWLLGRTGEAEENYRQGLGQLQHLMDEVPENPQYRGACARQRADLGQLYQHLGRFDEAQEAYRAAIRLGQEKVGSFPSLRRELAYAYNSLGGFPGIVGKEEYLLKSLELRDQLVREAPDDPAGQLDLATSEHNMGLVYYSTDRAPLAEGALRRAVRLWEGVLRVRPKARDARWNLSESCMVLAAVVEHDNPAEALALDQQALACREQLAQSFPTAWLYQEGLARIRHNLAGFYLHLGRPAEAEDQAKQAVAYRELAAAARPEGSGEHINLAEDLNTLGLIQAARQQTDRAEATLQRAIRLAAAAHGPEIRRAQIVLAAALLNLSETLCGAGRPADALPACQRAIETLDDLHRKDPADRIRQGSLANAIGARATALGRLGKHEQAVADWDRAVALTGTGDRGHFLLQRVRALAAAGDHARAVSEARALAADPGRSHEELYDLACVYAQAVGLARKDGKLSAVEQEHQVERYSVEALALLRRLHQASYFTTEARRARLSKDDRNLDPLRRRRDFQSLLAELSGNH